MKLITRAYVYRSTRQLYKEPNKASVRLKMVERQSAKQGWAALSAKHPAANQSGSDVNVNQPR